jgi:hypothetical protein
MEEEAVCVIETGHFGVNSLVRAGIRNPDRPAHKPSRYTDYALPAAVEWATEQDSF